MVLALTLIEFKVCFARMQTRVHKHVCTETLAPCTTEGVVMLGRCAVGVVWTICVSRMEGKGGHMARCRTSEHVRWCVPGGGGV